MKKIFIVAFLLLMVESPSFASNSDTFIYGAFGKVVIYKPVLKPEAFVLFISGDGKWNAGVISMAKNIVKQGAMVVGIDIQHYFKSIKNEKSKCYYPASDFEGLSLTLQKKYKFPQYLKPILVGYSSGATLAYGILAQAPANTFKGVISIGFSPDIELDRTLCNGTGLTTHPIQEGQSYFLETSEKLTAPFFVLQGMKDQVCDYKQTQKFMKQMKFGELITLPKVGHGFAVTRNWLPQFMQCYKKIVTAPSYAEKKAIENRLLQSQHLQPLPGDLPLIIIPSASKNSLPLAFVISGDGGWTSFDQTFSEQLAEKGIPVVGLDAQKYFWNAKTPEECTLAISKVVEHYMQQWDKKSFVLVGYSFGACVAPFITNRLSVPLKENIKGVFCLSPDETADFEIHLTDMLSFNTTRKYNVIDELKKIKEFNPVCVFGSEEDISMRNHFTESGVKTEILPGSHHYNNDFAALAEIILKRFVLKK